MSAQQPRQRIVFHGLQQLCLACLEVLLYSIASQPGFIDHDHVTHRPASACHLVSGISILAFQCSYHSPQLLFLDTNAGTAVQLLCNAAAIPSSAASSTVLCLSCQKQGCKSLLMHFERCGLVYFTWRCLAAEDRVEHSLLRCNLCVPTLHTTALQQWC